MRLLARNKAVKSPVMNGISLGHPVLVLSGLQVYFSTLGGVSYLCRSWRISWDVSGLWLTVAIRTLLAEGPGNIPWRDLPRRSPFWH